MSLALDRTDTSHKDIDPIPTEAVPSAMVRVDATPSA